VPGAAQERDPLPWEVAPAPCPAAGGGSAETEHPQRKRNLTPTHPEGTLGFYKMNLAKRSNKCKTMRLLQLQLQTNKYMNIKTACHLPLLPLTYRAEKTYSKYYF